MYVALLSPRPLP